MSSQTAFSVERLTVLIYHCKCELEQTNTIYSHVGSDTSVNSITQLWGWKHHAAHSHCCHVIFFFCQRKGKKNTSRLQSRRPVLLTQWTHPAPLVSVSHSLSPSLSLKLFGRCIKCSFSDSFSEKKCSAGCTSPYKMVANMTNENHIFFWFNFIQSTFQTFYIRWLISFTFPIA